MASKPQHRVAECRQADGDEVWDVTVYGYDAHGNVTARVDDRREDDHGGVVDGADGREHTFAYDGGDRLVEQHDAGADGDEPQRIRHAYVSTGWERGRWVDQLDGAGVWRTVQRTRWEHHANGKLRELQVHNREHDTAAEYHVEYRDAAGVYVNGHRTREWYYRGLAIDGDACALSACDVRYSYDARDRLVGHDNGRGGVTSFTLDAAGNLLAEDGPDGLYELTYQGGRLESLTADGATQHYHYDARARLACVTLQIGGDPGSGADCSPATGEAPAANVLADYGYDPLDRLRAYRSFLVDPAGVAPAAFDRDAAYDYDALDRLTAQTDRHDPDADPTVTLYDHLGLTGLVTGEHRADHLDRPLGSKYFTYDAFGSRVTMTDDPEAAFDPDPTATRERFTYVHDVHGSVAMLLDAAGNARATYGYTPYGRLDAAQTTGEDDPDQPFNPYRYSGHRSDSISGTIDMGARRYGPDTTRFLQPDRLPHAIADTALSLDPLTANRYALAGGNPITYVEHDGHVVIPNGAGGATTTPNPSDSPTNTTTSPTTQDAYQRFRHHEQQTYQQHRAYMSSRMAAGDPIAGRLRERAVDYPRRFVEDTPYRTAGQVATVPLSRLAGEEILRGHWSVPAPGSHEYIPGAPDSRPTVGGRAAASRPRGRFSPRIAGGLGGVAGGIEQGIRDWRSEQDLTGGQRVARVGVAAGIGAAAGAAGAVAAATVCVASIVCGVVVGGVAAVVVGFAGDIAVGSIADRVGLGEW